MKTRHLGARVAPIVVLVVASCCLFAASALPAGTSTGRAALAASPAAPVAKTPSAAVAAVRPVFIWSKVAGATRYEIRVYSGTTLALKKTGITRCSWTSSIPLPRGVAFTWKVRAGNRRGTGAWSKSRSFVGSSLGSDDIAYTLKGDISAISPVGGAPVSLTAGSSWDYGMAWSPDHSRLAFIRRPSRDKSWLNDGAVYLFDSGDGAITRLRYQGPSLAAASGSLAWSPNGRFLAGACRRDPKNRYSKPQLTVLDLQTLRTHVVYTVDERNGPSVCSLDWSPDSTQLVACAYWADPAPTYRVNVATGALVQYSYNGAYTVSWSRADWTILLDEFGPDAMYRIQRRTSDGDLLNTLWDQSISGLTGDEEWSPVYSPSGSQVAYFAWLGDRLSLRSAKPDGSGIVTVRAFTVSRDAAFGVSAAWK